MSVSILAFFAFMALATSAAGDERVSASWYGDELRGNKTASGERFDPNGRTVAHKSLPFGTCLACAQCNEEVEAMTATRGTIILSLALTTVAWAQEPRLLAPAICALAGNIRHKPERHMIMPAVSRNVVMTCRCGTLGCCQCELS